MVARHFGLLLKSLLEFLPFQVPFYLQFFWSYLWIVRENLSFASRIVSNSTLFNFHTTSASSSSSTLRRFLSHISTGKIRQTLRSLNIPKQFVRMVRQLSSSKCVLLSWLLLDFIFCVLRSNFLSSRCLGNTQRISCIPKRGDLPGYNNYCPISLTIATSEVLEISIYDQKRSFLEHEGQLGDCRYGFRSSRSTGDPLAVVPGSWSVSLDNHKESRLVRLNISKAFDRVWHADLLPKLPTSRFSPSLVSWTSSFHSERDISIGVNGVLSQPFIANTGAPLGSRLARTLFPLFITDLLYITSNWIYSFTDDDTSNCIFALIDIRIPKSFVAAMSRTHC